MPARTTRTRNRNRALQPHRPVAVVNARGASSTNKQLKRQISHDVDTHPPAPLNKKAKLQVSNAKKLHTKGPVQAPAPNEGVQPELSVTPATSLADFVSSPPDTTGVGRPVINAPPTAVLRILVFGTGDMCGELGLGPKQKEAALPTVVPKLDGRVKGAYRIVQLDCGGMHAVALTEGGKMIVTWGGNDEGALGRNTEWDGGLRDIGPENGKDGDDASSGSDDEPLNPLESCPTHIPESSFPPGTRFTCVAAGDNSSFVVTETGLVYGWGTFRNTDGKRHFLCYKGESVTRINHPILIPGLRDIRSVVCGGNHALALDTSGRVWSWGINEMSQVGHQSRSTRLRSQMDDTHHLYPATVDLGLAPVKYLAAGPFHSLAVNTQNKVFAWGLNNLGQAGYAENAGEDAATLDCPVLIRSLSKQKGGIQMISAGDQHSAAVTGDGRCLVWGNIDKYHGFKLTEEQSQNSKLVLQDERGRPRILLQPLPVPNIGEAAYVACSRSHTIFVNKAGKAYTAGFGTEMQLGNGGDHDHAVARPVKGLDGLDVQWCGASASFSMLAAVE